MLAIALARGMHDHKTYHEAILLAEDGLVNMPRGVEMGQDDGTHGDSLRRIEE